MLCYVVKCCCKTLQLSTCITSDLKCTAYILLNHPVDIAYALTVNAINVTTIPIHKYSNSASNHAAVRKSVQQFSCLYFSPNLTFVSKLNSFMTEVSIIQKPVISTTYSEPSQTFLMEILTKIQLTAESPLSIFS